MAPSRVMHVWIAAIVVILDQAVKALVRSKLQLYESTSIVPGLLDLTRVHNTGMAYGFMQSSDFPFKTVVVALLAAFALAALAMYGSTLAPEQRISRLGLAFIMGGAAGNLVDRLTLGYVLDFVDVYRGAWHFWAFNVADASITLGVVLMILDLLGLGRFVAGTTRKSAPQVER
jgi:signal peptidase II